ncbi:MAG: hypothetical protein ACR2M6_00370 [Vampirovibrionia bacterium]
MSNQENNKMIAEFMGLELEETLEGLFVYARKEQSPIKLNDIRTEFYEVHELQYHISWDWLMPVVKKCWKIINELDMSFDKVIFKYRFDYIVYADFKESYEAIVEFINEYNKNK